MIEKPENSTPNLPHSGAIEPSKSETMEPTVQHSIQNVSLNLMDNKYVLIVNNQGQPIPSHQSEPEKPKTPEKLWPVESNLKKSVPHDNFFSMTMSPLDNDLSSPSTQMEHLRLSSPVDQELADNLLPNLSGLDIVSPDSNGSYQSNSSLRTINEESLRELLYGISGK